MKHLITIFSIVLAAIPAFTQQLAGFTQFRSYQYAFNPAVLDVFELQTDAHPMDIDLAYRTQWTGYEDAPSTALIGLQYADLDLDMAFGGMLVHDQFGPTDYTQLQVHYSYQINFERLEYHYLSIGLSASLSQYRIENSLLDLETPEDPLIGEDDQTKLSPNLGVGLYYHRKLGTYSSDGTYLFGGVSVEQIIPADIQFQSGTPDGGNLKREPHFHGFAGIRLYYDGTGHDYLEPVIWARKVFNAPLHVDAGFRMTVAQQRFWFGASFGSDFQAFGMFGINVSETWGFNYAGGTYLTTQLGRPAGMTHEFSLSYRIKF